MRALAGLWPHADGSVSRPLGHQALFLSQRPYLPLGDLRTAIAYPADGLPADDARMQQALRQVNLAHLAERLGEQRDWSRILSVGEQQRLAFARVLFNQPQIVFLDESTSAMDEARACSVFAAAQRNAAHLAGECGAPQHLGGVSYAPAGSGRAGRVEVAGAGAGAGHACVGHRDRLPRVGWVRYGQSTVKGIDLETKKAHCERTRRLNYAASLRLESCATA